jgi:hypothetical protein
VTALSAGIEGLILRVLGVDLDDLFQTAEDALGALE